MASAKTTTTQASRMDELRAQMAADEAARLEAEAQIAQIRADEAKAAAKRARMQGTATAPRR